MMRKLLLSFSLLLAFAAISQTPIVVPDPVKLALEKYGSPEFVTSIEKIDIDEEDFYWEVYFEKGKKSYIFEIDQKGNIVSKEDISE